jgi:hypothetical protein
MGRSYCSARDCTSSPCTHALPSTSMAPAAPARRPAREQGASSLPTLPFWDTASPATSRHPPLTASSLGYPPAQVELTGQMWPAPRQFSERDLLLLVEALAGAGCPWEAFLEDNPEPELVHPTLPLAARGCCWSPEQHSEWPPKFRAAAREFLLLARARGAVASAAAAQGPAGGGVAGGAGGFQMRGGKRGRTRLEPMLGRPAGARLGRCTPGQPALQAGQAERVWLPAEVCCNVLEAASRCLSDWV